MPHGHAALDDADGVARVPHGDVAALAAREEQRVGVLEAPARRVAPVRRPPVPDVREPRVDDPRRL